MNRKEIFQNAWEMAKLGAKKFGGSCKDYFSISLKMSYAGKKVYVMTAEEKGALALATAVKELEEEMARVKGGYVNSSEKIWEARGVKRLYLSVWYGRYNKYKRERKVGYIDLINHVFVAA